MPYLRTYMFFFNTSFRIISRIRKKNYYRNRLISDLRCNLLCLIKKKSKNFPSKEFTFHICSIIYNKRGTNWNILNRKKVHINDDDAMSKMVLIEIPISEHLFVKDGFFDPKINKHNGLVAQIWQSSLHLDCKLFVMKSIAQYFVNIFSMKISLMNA